MNTPENNDNQQIILRLPPQLLHMMSPAMPPQADASAGDEMPRSINFAGMGKEILRRWWLILLTTGACVAAMWGYLAKTPKIYAAHAKIEVEQEQARVLNGQGVTGVDIKSLEMLKTIEEKITGQGMLLRIIKSNALDKDPTWAKPRGFAYRDDELVEMLRRRVTASLDRGTRLIEIIIEDTDPARAKRLADSFLTECTSVSRQNNSAAAAEVRRSLEAERDKVRDHLDAAERAVSDYRNACPEMPLEENPSDMKSNIFEDRVKALSRQIGENRADLVELANGAKQAADARSRGAEALLKISAIASLEEIISLSKTYGDKKNTFARVDSRYLPKHPTYITSSRDLKEAWANLERAALNAADGMNNRLEAAKQTETKLQEDLEKAKAELVTFQRRAAEFDVLARELRSQREHYSQVLARMKEAEVIQDFAGSTLRIADTPITPSLPIKPRRNLLLAGAGLGGIMLGVALALFLRMLDRTLRDMSSAERELGMPGLAAVPQSAVRSGPDSLLTSPNCRPETAESFRSLRTSLALLGKGITARTFLFTSANPGEGKSYCAANCAAALAQQGYRTLLIDADMRKPSLDEVFLASPNPAGLASHLSGIAPSGGAKACNPTAIPNLFLFSAGLSSDSHPAELLSSQAFSTLLAEALKWFHRIVIDTPPVNQVTDALLMAREVDSVALVVKAARTSRADARHAISKLSMAGARPVGFVLNGASRDALAGGYTGSYAYGQPLALPYPALALPQPSHA